MLAFLWRATRGYRLRPWCSPYLGWRLETYWGIRAEGVDARTFLKFYWRQRREMWRYLRWTGRMSRLIRAG